jgi:hypothetical protein
MGKYAAVFVLNLTYSDYDRDGYHNIFVENSNKSQGIYR